MVLVSILSHVHIVKTQHAVIYSLNYLGKKILARAIFPEFHCVGLSIDYHFTRQRFFKRVYTGDLN